MKKELKPACFTNRTASLAYKIVLLVVCLVSLVLNTGLLSRTFAPYRLFYYTAASHLFVFVFYLISVIVTGVAMKKTGNTGPVKLAPHFKGAVVMAMLTTMFVYQFMLAETPFALAGTGVYLANVLAHIIVPLMVLADWALFDPKGAYAGGDPLSWLIIPFVYYGVILLVAAQGMEYYGGVAYPYVFINPDRVRWIHVIVNVFLFMVGYVAAGYVFFGIDRLVSAIANRQPKETGAEALPVEMPPDGARPAAEGELHQLNDLVNTGAGQPPLDAAAPAAAPAQPQPVAAPAAPAPGAQATQVVTPQPPQPQPTAAPAPQTAPAGTPFTMSSAPAPKGTEAPKDPGA